MFLIATGLVGTWAIHLTISTLAFLFKIPLGAGQLWLSLILTSALLWYLAGRVTTKNKITVFVSAISFILAISIMGIWISGSVYDMSFDGQAYHQEAIIQLARGWNPVYMKLDGQATANLERWLNHYPKGLWLIATSIYKVTGNLESGKFLSIVAPFIAIAFGFWSLWRIKMKSLFKILLVVCLVANPVVIYQSLSFYLDGILVSVLLSLGFIGLRMVVLRDRMALWPYLLALIVLINLKLSAVVFALIFVFTLFMILWTKNLLRFSLRTIKVSLLGLVIGVLFVGYNPYVTNFVLEGHPLYPAMGKRAIDYLPTNMPENYLSIMSPLRLMSSIFASSTLERGKGSQVSAKNPFTVNRQEIEAFRETSVKTGGFGPLFGLIFSLSIILLICCFIFGSIKKTRSVFIVVLLTIFGTAGMVSMSNVARFVPFVWWVPGIAVGASLISRKSWLPIVGIFLTLICILNLSIIASSYYPYDLTESKLIEGKLRELARNQNGVPISIYVAQFGSVKIKLIKHGIAFEEIQSTVDCQVKTRLLPHNITEVCQAPTSTPSASL